MTTSPCDDRRCFIDGDDGSEGCVLDDGDLYGCDVASSLHANGLCETDCQHWRYPEAVANSRETAAQRVAVKRLIQVDAAKMREARLQSNIEFDLVLAASAPDPTDTGEKGCVCPRERKSDAELYTR